MKKIIFTIIYCAILTTAFSQDTPTREPEKGTAYVRIKKGVITFRRDLPSEKAQASISEKLKGEANGFYKIQYELSASNETPIVVNEKTKMDTNSAKVLKTIAAFVVIIGGLIAKFS